jgi:hypothetical protein
MHAYVRHSSTYSTIRNLDVGSWSSSGAELRRYASVQLPIASEKEATDPDPESRFRYRRVGGLSTMIMICKHSVSMLDNYLEKPCRYVRVMWTFAFDEQQPKSASALVLYTAVR